MAYKSKHTGAQVDEAVSKVLNGEVGDAMPKVTYEELKSLRDNSQLVPGQQYRITDYVTTTIQENTQSARHQFDVIVTADDVNVLNENARAIQHDGDTYFNGSKLESWELKYRLDNDSNRFAWADDSDNGKGVIYYMKDEFNNECPYDFKNIQFFFKRNLDGSVIYCYTFGEDTDYSISGSNYGNVIKEYKHNNKIQLNNIVFLDKYCYYNSFGNNCYDNNFGSSCNSNIFGNKCYNNSFGNGCYCNSFGNNCVTNSFGNNCHDNSFGNYSDGNRFGRNCYYNSFGNGCYCNSFGDDCYSNSFGNQCGNNSFGESITNTKSYYRHIIFDSGNRYINLNCTSTTSSSKYYQNVRIGLGANNTNTNKIINDSNVGQTYQTVYKPANSKDLTA